MIKTTGPKTRVTLQAMLLVVLVWGVYSNALQGPFAFDDWHVIPQNPSVHQLANIPAFYSDPAHFSVLVGNRDYRPTFLTSMAVAWRLGDGETWPFHATGVTLHALNAVLLFLILRLFFARRRDRAGGDEVHDGPEAGDWAAFLAAALFAVHPLATESVNYISSQSVPMAALFYLLAFYVFLTAYDSPSHRARARPAARLAVSSVAYFLALLSKPIAITLPLNLLVWEALFGARSAAERSMAPGSITTRLRKHIPYWAVTALYLLIRRAVFEPGGGVVNGPRPRFTHYLTETNALVSYYLRLAVAPFGLNVDREWGIVASLLDPRFLIAAGVIAALAALVYRFRDERALVFWALWFPICLLVTTYAVVLFQIVNEHRVYLSLAGFAAVVGVVGLRLTDRIPSHRRAVAVAAMVVLGAFAVITRERNELWGSDTALWANAARGAGTWRAHMNHALALEGEGRSQEALAEFERAVEMDANAWSHLNLGHAHIRRRNYDEGLENLRIAVNLWPALPEAHVYLGYGLQRAGQVGEAIEELRRAIELRPAYRKGYEWLGSAYEAVEEYGSAAQTYRELAGLEPAHPWAANRARLMDARAAEREDPRLALDLIRAGRYQEAVGVLTSSYAETPRNADLLFNLGFSHQRLGNDSLAIRFYEELLAVSPNHRRGTFNLAYAYLHADDEGSWSRSAELFGRVLEIDPDYDESIHHRASAYWKLGSAEEGARLDRLYLERGRHADLRERSEGRLR